MTRRRGIFLYLIVAFWQCFCCTRVTIWRKKFPFRLGWIIILNKRFHLFFLHTNRKRNCHLSIIRTYVHNSMRFSYKRRILDIIYHHHHDHHHFSPISYTAGYRLPLSVRCLSGSVFAGEPLCLRPSTLASYYYSLHAGHKRITDFSCLWNEPFSSLQVLSRYFP